METGIRVDSTFKLQVVVYATTAVSVNVAYRQRINGEDGVPSEQNIASGRITTNGAPNYFYYQFAGNNSNTAELINAVVSLVTANVQRGQCFVRVGLTIGGTDSTAVTPFRVLFSDYITSNSALAFPGSEVKSSLEGRGHFTLLTEAGTDEQSYTFAANIFNRVYSMYITSTTSATVANRNMYVELLQFTGTTYAVQSTFNQTAGTTMLYLLNSNGYALSDLSDKKYLTLPTSELYFDAGGTIVIAPVNKDSDDAYVLSIVCERWIKA